MANHKKYPYRVTIEKGSFEEEDNFENKEDGTFKKAFSSLMMASIIQDIDDDGKPMDRFELISFNDDGSSAGGIGYLIWIDCIVSTIRPIIKDSPMVKGVYEVMEKYLKYNLSKILRPKNPPFDKFLDN